MAIIESGPTPIPFEALAWQSPLFYMREAIVQTIRNDSVLTSLLGTDNFRVVYRPAKIPERYPVVSFFDFGTRPDAQVPLMDRTIQFDVWGQTLDQAERIAERLEQLFDFPEARRRGVAPWSVGMGLRVEQSLLTTDRNDVLDDGDTTRKTLEFRVLAYKR